MSTHEVHLRQNDTLPWFGIETAKKISYIIESEIA